MTNAFLASYLTGAAIVFFAVLIDYAQYPKAEVGWLFRTGAVIFWPVTVAIWIARK